MLLTLSQCLPHLRCVATGTAVDTQEANVINTSAVNLGLGSVVIDTKHLFTRWVCVRGEFACAGY